MVCCLILQVKISFDDHATTTFEYEGEESALENYLQEHPEEREEVQKQEEDVATHSTEELLHDSPRAPDPDVSAMKSNTVIGSSGKLCFVDHLIFNTAVFGENSRYCYNLSLLLSSSC